MEIQKDDMVYWLQEPFRPESGPQEPVVVCAPVTAVLENGDVEVEYDPDTGEPTTVKKAWILSVNEYPEEYGPKEGDTGQCPYCGGTYVYKRWDDGTLVPVCPPEKTCVDVGGHP